MGIDIREASSQVVREVHKSDSHGDTLYIDFENGDQLVVWAFERPTNLQMVYWNPNNQQIIQDKRSKDCREYTEMVYRKLLARTPPVDYAKESPFKVYHQAHPIPD